MERNRGERDDELEFQEAPELNTDQVNSSLATNSIQLWETGDSDRQTFENMVEVFSLIGEEDTT